MCREIKFRALKDDVSDCKFYYGSLIYNKQCIPRIYDVDTDTFYTCIKGTESQYTGLKDKNIKQIFDGDISKDGLGRAYKITFHHGSFWLQMINGTYSERLHTNGQIEVIGNIYQNPELLNN